MTDDIRRRSILKFTQEYQKPDANGLTHIEEISKGHIQQQLLWWQLYKDVFWIFNGRVEVLFYSVHVVDALNLLGLQIKNYEQVGTKF